MCQRLQEDCSSRVQHAIEELTQQQRWEFARLCEQWEEEHRTAEERREEQWQESQQRRDAMISHRLAEQSRLTAHALRKLHQ